jgi:hypothetical protein|tara:strand:+ start:165 stop:689 length:525 start_codon:yes stop_codon:yes gene_type:complete
MSAKRKEISQLPIDVRELINEVARYAAVEIMNDLAEAGPEWTGKFQDSWIAVPIGRAASGSTGGGYPYTLNDVPKLSTSIKETARVKKFEIVNTQPYAEYALDLKEGKFRGIGNPAGEVVATGSRPVPGRRGDVSGTGGARSTAPLDWYTSYLNGGGMAKALEAGVTFAFKSRR